MIPRAEARGSTSTSMTYRQTIMDINQEISRFAFDHPEVWRRDQALCGERDKYLFRVEAPMASTPYLIDRSRYDLLTQRTESIHSAIEVVLEQFRQDPGVRNYFSHLAPFQWLIDLPKTTTQNVPTARFDLIEDGHGGFGMIETNAACPHGMSTIPASFEILRETAVYDHVDRTVRLTHVPVQDRRTIFDFLASEYRARFGDARKPRIGIGHALPQTGSRPDVLAILEGKALSGRICGYECEVVPIHALRRRNGRVEFDGRPIDVLYQFLDPALDRPLSGFATNASDIDDYIEAIKREEMLVVNPFRSMFVAEDKSILALLHDPEFSSLFSQEQRQAIEAIVPPTYRLRTQQVTYMGETEDLLSLLKRRKDDFVIKKQIANDGRDIWVGHQMQQDEWEAGLREAMGGLYVAQRMLPGSKQRLPTDDADGARIYHGTLGMAMVNGKAIGMYHRISPRYVTNLNQGGGKQNILVYDDSAGAATS